MKGKPGDHIEMGAEAGRSGLEYPGELFRRAEGEGDPRRGEGVKKEDPKKPEAKKE